MVSDAQKRANAKYRAAHYDRFEITLQRGGKSALADFARGHDSSTNAYILGAIRRRLEDDGASPDTIRAICGDGSGAAR